MIRQISIVAVSNGWVVTVGCQQIVYRDAFELKEQLFNYLRNPEETEKKFLETAVNIKHTLSGNPTPIPPETYGGCNAVPMAATSVGDGRYR